MARSPTAKTPVTDIDPSVWPIVSKVVLAFLGGGILTYWVGGAVANLLLTSDLYREDITLASGVVQLTTFTFFPMYVSVETSQKRAWIVWAILTALSIALSYIPQAVS